MSEIIGCYSREIARASPRDSTMIALARAARCEFSARQELTKGGGGETRACKIDFNRSLVTIMRPGNGDWRSLPR